MSLLDSSTAAALEAERNFAANRTAVAVRQAEMADLLFEPSNIAEWVYGRDGSLTALDSQLAWISGSSLPLRIARSMLASLETRASVACFLAPAHAAQIQAALEHLQPEQAVICIVPDTATLTHIFHCASFSEPLNQCRLWFVTGDGWAMQLQQLLLTQTGLAVPASFIRMPNSPATEIDPLIAEAQRIFTSVHARRGAMLAQVRGSYCRPMQRKLCVVAPGRFRLWNDLTPALRGALDDGGSINSLFLDSDNPLFGSPNALAEAACECDALLTVNTSRADLPGLVADEVRWITWMTASRVPPASSGNDHLIAAHESLRASALAAGWPAERVHLGAWPFRPLPVLAAEPFIAIIEDTHSLKTPTDLQAFSSHAVLWETIREQLLANPFAMQQVDLYLDGMLKRHQIADAAFSRQRFVSQLMLPAYLQGLAHTLVAARVPVKLYGRGWDELPGLLTAAEDVIASRSHLEQIVGKARALVHPAPLRVAHPICFYARPVLAARNSTDFLRQAWLMLAGKVGFSRDGTPPLNAALINTVINAA